MIFPWLVAAIAALGATARVVQLIRLSVDHEILARILVKKLDEGNFDHARKLVSLIPESDVGPALVAVLDRGLEMKLDEPTKMEPALRAIFDAEHGPTAAKLDALRIVDGFMLLFAFASTALALREGVFPIWVFVIAASAILGAAWCVVRTVRLHRGATQLRDVVIPKLADALGKPRDAYRAAPEPAPRTVAREAPPPTVDSEDAFFFGFDDRNPKLFHQLLCRIARTTNEACKVMTLRRKKPPQYVVALLATKRALHVVRTAFDESIEASYAKCPVPRDEIAPDATYGAETLTATRVRMELRRGELEVVDEEQVGPG